MRGYIEIEGDTERVRNMCIPVRIDATVFHDIPAKRQPFLAMADELGKAVEGIALRLAERIARRLLDLDEIVAAFLGEPTDTVTDGAPTADA